ncbi:MAG: hypothetical protein M1837_004135 [Sclerophora amabilis]|nr:MAG: hypothetical protein M1837_004135 [Sclerophora amabilis]
MYFGKNLVLGLVAAMSAATMAAPAPDALEKRTCPRYDVGAAQAIASLYLGAGNNKSNQVERLIEELLGLLVGNYPTCEPNKIYLECGEKQYWGSGQPPTEVIATRDALPEALATNNEPVCPDKYPLQSCKIRCHGQPKC